MLFLRLNNGVLNMWNLWLGIDTFDGAVIDLYTNVIVPAVTDTLSAYTICTLGGYAPITLTPGNWGAPTTAGGSTFGTYPNITFNFNAYAGGVTIQGAVWRNQTNTIAYQAANLDTPYPVPPGGGSLTLSITDTEQNC